MNQNNYQLRLVTTLLLVSLFLAVSSCESGPKTNGGVGKEYNTQTYVDPYTNKPITAETARRQPGNAKPNNNQSVPTQTADPSGLSNPQIRPTQQQTDSTASQVVWAIPLVTLASDNHKAEIYIPLSNIKSKFPQLNSGLWVHSNDKGSMVLFGRFRSVEDSGAQSQLRLIKTLKTGDLEPFIGTYLTRIDLTTRNRILGPYDLRTLRRDFPKVNPLYTVDVATWIVPEDNVQAWGQAKKQAESYTTQLRGQGHEAYFFHNEKLKVSSVMVGKFDRRVVDTRSGLYSMEVQRLLKQFPIRLTNGVELLVMVDPNNINGPKEPQKPLMVQVPLKFD